MGLPSASTQEALEKKRRSSARAGRAPRGTAAAAHSLTRWGDGRGDSGGGGSIEGDGGGDGEGDGGVDGGVDGGDHGGAAAAAIMKSVVVAAAVAAVVVMATAAAAEVAVTAAVTAAVVMVVVMELPPCVNSRIRPALVSIYRAVQHAGQRGRPSGDRAHRQAHRAAGVGVPS